MAGGCTILLVGGAASELCLAAGMAGDLGADVRMIHGLGDALACLRKGGVDLVLVEVSLDVAGLIGELRRERLNIPVVACGIAATAEQAVAAVRAGARDYVPLPPERELIAAVLHSFAHPEPPVADLVGQTVDDVERALILSTLEHCGGNRTSASLILGISIRTMRNKLKAFTDAGYLVAPAA